MTNETIIPAGGDTIRDAQGRVYSILPNGWSGYDLYDVIGYLGHFASVAAARRYVESL